MKKINVLLLILFIVQVCHSQSLLKSTFLLGSNDPINPQNQPGGNAISVLEVQKFKDSTFVWIGTAKGLSRLNIETNQWKNYRTRKLYTYKSELGQRTLTRGGVSALAVKDSIIWVATIFDSVIATVDHQIGGGLSYSLDGGKNWKNLPQPGETPVDNTTWDIAIADTTVWITSFGGGIKKTSNWMTADWLSDDFRPTWNTITPDEYNFDPAEFPNHRGFSVLGLGDTVWVGTAGGINKSLDGGKTWVNFNHQNQDFPISGNWVLAIINQKFGDRDIIWASTVETTAESEDTTEFRGVSKTEDQGYTWTTCLKGIRIENFAFDDSVVYACSESGLYKSLDFGETWAIFPPIVDFSSGVHVYSESVYDAGITDDHVLWAGTPDGLATTSDDGLTWKVYRTFVSTGKYGEPPTYAYPNPFSPLRNRQFGGDGYIRFQFNSDNNPQVILRIFDFAMDLITTIDPNIEQLSDKDYAIAWNCKTPGGKLLANGVYFYQLTIEGKDTHWGKFIILD